MESFRVPKPAPRGAHWRLGLLVFMVLIVFALGLIFLASRARFPYPAQPQPNQPTARNSPRNTPEIAFRNTGPEVKYVGDESCAGCHPTQAATYRHHPMGQALAPIAAVAEKQHYGKENHNPFHPFDQFNLELLVQPRDGKDFHKQSLEDAGGNTILEHEDPVDFVLGSGTRGVLI